MYNLILDIDSYKASHFKQYPEGTQQISSYIESRGGKYSHILFFGLQRFIQKYFLNPISKADIDQAEQILTNHGVPFNRQGWEYILEKHNGYLPLKIEAVKEGTVLPTSNVLVQVTNTDPNCFWLTSYVETALLRAVWYPTTVATLSFHCKQTIYDFLKQSSDLEDKDVLDMLAFKLHDFGARGASSTETCEIGGLSHLVNFKGTDSVLSLLDAKDYYDCPMAGFSIPAAEHSTITSWGKDGEYDAIVNLIDNYCKPGKTVSIVCDSYDLDNALTNIIGSKEVKQKIATSGGTVVVRPDSGIPHEIVLHTMQKLESIFGCSFNNAGFKVLPPYIRVIQGDGVNTNSIKQICEVLVENGYSIENIAFGMGAELQQKVNRDTCRFAMKASAIYINDAWLDVFKQPKTDLTKTSKPGVLKLVKDQNEFKTVRIDDQNYQNDENYLETVFENGKLVRHQTLDEVREIAQSSLHTKVEVFN